jgi:hypothetical protein
MRFYALGISARGWNPNADIASPWNVIGLSDLVTLALHYGWTTAS